jgi:hypothetical protein
MSKPPAIIPIASEALVIAVLNRRMSPLHSYRGAK